MLDLGSPLVVLGGIVVSALNPGVSVLVLLPDKIKTPVVVDVEAIVVSALTPASELLLVPEVIVVTIPPCTVAGAEALPPEAFATYPETV